MHFRFKSSPDAALGDLGALLRQLDTPSDPRTITGGYATLMAKVASPSFRNRSGRSS